MRAFTWSQFCKACPATCTSMLKLVVEELGFMRGQPKDKTAVGPESCRITLLDEKWRIRGCRSDSDCCGPQAATRPLYVLWPRRRCLRACCESRNSTVVLSFELIRKAAFCSAYGAVSERQSPASEEAGPGLRRDFGRCAGAGGGCAASAVPRSLQPRYSQVSALLTRMMSGHSLSRLSHPMQLA